MCMYVRAYVCMHANVFVCVCARMHAYVYVCVSVQACVRISDATIIVIYDIS